MESLHYIHLEVLLFFPVLQHCFWKCCFLSTGVSTWKDGVLIPVTASSAVVFLFHMHTKEDLNNRHKNILMLKLGSAAFVLPKLNVVVFHGAEFIQPSNHCLRVRHLFHCSLPAFLMSTWAQQEPELAMLTGGHSSHCLCKPTPWFWQSLT